MKAINIFNCRYESTGSKSQGRRLRELLLQRDAKLRPDHVVHLLAEEEIAERDGPGADEEAYSLIEVESAEDRVNPNTGAGFDSENQRVVVSDEADEASKTELSVCWVLMMIQEHLQDDRQEHIRVQAVVQPVGKDRIQDSREHQLAVDGIQAPEQRSYIRCQRDAERREEKISNFPDGWWIFGTSFVCADEVVDEGEGVENGLEDLREKSQIN